VVAGEPVGQELDVRAGEVGIGVAAGLVRITGVADVEVTCRCRHRTTGDEDREQQRDGDDERPEHGVLRSRGRRQPPTRAAS
jgi:hypothetical protein